MKLIQSIYNFFYRIIRRLNSYKFISGLKNDLIRYKYKEGLYRNADWFMFGLVILIALFGVVSIFSATATATDTEVTGLLNLLNTHSTHYAGQQLMWIGIGILLFFFFTAFDYHLFGKYASHLYFIQIIILTVLILFAQVGRGGMQAFLNLGNFGIQPSELCKIIMIIATANLFAKRKRPMQNFWEVVPSGFFVGIPALLVLLQPDFGTMVVYVMIYLALLIVSGTNNKLIWGTILVAVAVAIPLWYYLNTASDNFRLTRILMWFNPEKYPDEARQVINGQIAIGSGGLLGKGLTSVGSFASLGYIPDDHTDFCFSILCESFGFIGALSLLTGFSVLLYRILFTARKASDKFGEYIVIGVFAMYGFHIIENIGMIIGILPVTGIPLPFISYGGSNCLTNFAALGLVVNVGMRSKQKVISGHNRYTKQL